MVSPLAPATVSGRVGSPGRTPRGPIRRAVVLPGDFPAPCKKPCRRRDCNPRFSGRSGAHPVQPAHRQPAEHDQEPGDRGEPRERVVPRDAADEALADAGEDRGHGVDRRDHGEPAGEQILGRVGGGEQRRDEPADLHQRRRLLRAELQRHDHGVERDRAAQPHDEQRGDDQRAGARPVDAEHQRDRDQERPRQQRAQRRRGDDSDENRESRSGADQQPVEPAALDVAGEVDAGRRAAERRALEQADRDDERAEVRGVEAGDLRRLAEHAGQPDHEDRRSEHAGDRGARHAGDLVQRTAHQRADDGEARAHASRSLPRSAATASATAPAVSASETARPSSTGAAETPEMIGSRIPLAMKLSGLYGAIQLAGALSRSSGKNALETKSTTKTSGKIPWTVDALRARSASTTPSAAKPVPATTPIRRTARTPGTPPWTWTPRISPSARKYATWTTATAEPAKIRPRTMATRGIGAATSRSKKPPSISSAAPIPCETPPSSSDWVIAAASWKSRNDRTGGKPGRSVELCRPPTLTARNSVGKTSSGASSGGRRSALSSPRRARATTTRVTPARRRAGPPAPRRRRRRPPRRPAPRGGDRRSARRRRRASVARAPATPPGTRPRRVRGRPARSPPRPPRRAGTGGRGRRAAGARPRARAPGPPRRCRARPRRA